MVGERFDYRIIAICVYFVVFFMYFFIGFYPVDASNYKIYTKLEIPSISLVADVTRINLDNGKLNTPDTIVGSFSKNNNKTLLIGHSSTIFHNLNKVRLRDRLNFDNMMYRITNIDMITKEKIKMKDLLKSESTNQIVIMTCAGKRIGDSDATHRLILTAEVE